MAYTLNQGVGSSNSRFDHVQRTLLVGLPALALALLIGAIISHHASKSPAGAAPQIIPVVSAANTSGFNSSAGNGGNNSSDKGASTNSLSATTSAQIAGGGSALGSSPVSPGMTTSGPGGSGSVVGGRGGGSGGTGGTSIPDCTLDQIATVTCMVPACSPPVTLAPGQKAILGVNGTCVVVN
jgi:hypothetical protein